MIDYVNEWHGGVITANVGWEETKEEEFNLITTNPAFDPSISGHPIIYFLSFIRK